MCLEPTTDATQGMQETTLETIDDVRTEGLEGEDHDADRPEQQQREPLPVVLEEADDRADRSEYHGLDAVERTIDDVAELLAVLVGIDQPGRQSDQSKHDD